MDDLPHFTNKSINWKQSIGYKIKFIYDDIQGFFLIKNYETNGKNPKVYISYYEKENWISTSNLLHAKIGGFLRCNNKKNSNIINLTGQKFGQLTVIEDDGHRDDRGNILWKCLCDCGKTKYANGVKLRQGSIISCGCVYRRYFKPKIKTEEQIKKQAVSKIIGRYKSKAKERNLSWNLNREIFENTIKKPCYYCGISSSLSLKIQNYSYNYNGIDRINSKNGYEENNIVPCCKTCNMSKSDMSQEDFYSWIKRVANNLNLIEK